MSNHRDFGDQGIYLRSLRVYGHRQRHRQKDTPEQFSCPRNSGLIALDLEDDNTLVGAAITNGSCDILLCASSVRPPVSKNLMCVPWGVVRRV